MDDIRMKPMKLHFELVDDSGRMTDNPSIIPVREELPTIRESAQST
jgi:hypothetical protein